MLRWQEAEREAVVAATTVREIERKYEAPGRPEWPDLTGIAGVASVADQGTVDLDATYYDTVDLRLAAVGITLRRRTGGEDSGWHLKLPVDGDTRDEIRQPLRAAEQVPLSLARLVRAHTRDLPLKPIARLRTSRGVRHLFDRQGRLVAEVCLDRVSAQRMDAGGPGATEWVEIEVELKGDEDGALLDAAERRFAEAGIERSAAASKLARALGDQPAGEHAKRLRKRGDEQGAARSTSGKRRRPRTAGEAVLAYLREQVTALLATDIQVRRDTPDSVHQMRVAARRMRSALSTFRMVLDRELTGPIAEELRWLGAELGADRDREVLTERLYQLLNELPRADVLGPVRGRLRTWAGTRRSGTRRRVLAALNSSRHLELLNALDGLLADPPLLPAAAEPAPKVLAGAVLRDYRRLARRVAAATTQEERHDCRKAAKRARYAAEASRSVLGKSARPFVRQMKAVQEVLGESQDGVVVREALRDLAGQAHASGEHTFTYGLLDEREAMAASAAQKRFAQVWREASRKKYRDSLGA